MNYKQNFIKRERVDAKKIPTIKDTYKSMSDKQNLRKDETFVLMFRDFIFFDVKSYECRNGDLYIRNIVDGIILKRYFRMGSDDQLTVFKNRAEFDEFMDKVKEEGYMFGPQKIFDRMNVHLSGSIQSYGDNLSGSINNPKIENIIKKGNENFILENFSGIRNSETGKIDIITSTWEGASVTRDDCPDLFDEVARVLEANPGSAQIMTKKDFM